LDVTLSCRVILDVEDGVFFERFNDKLAVEVGIIQQFLATI